MQHNRSYDIVLSYVQYISLYCKTHNIGINDQVDFALDVIRTLVYDPFEGAMTLTFGETVESHVGMQKIGQIADRGFQYDDLVDAQAYFDRVGCETILVHLNDFLPEDVSDRYEREQLTIAKNDMSFQGWLLVIRQGLKCLMDESGAENLLTEMLLFPWDKKLYNNRRKIVQNKLARWNLNFSNTRQIANFEEGKGTTVPWVDVPLLYQVKQALASALGEAGEDLRAEGNRYEICKNTGIGPHGDSERRKVVGLRLGACSMRIMYYWHYNNLPRGKSVSLTLDPGDMYIMGEKTVGTDWLLAPKKQYTLRHSAGARQYTTLTPKIHIENERQDVKYPDITVGDIYFRPASSKEEFKLMPQ